MTAHHPITADSPALTRARGAARVVSKPGRRGSVLETVFQKGCAKIVFPAHQEPGLTAVSLNTAGGLTGGDVLTVAATAGAGSHLRMTTQAAERIYRSVGGVARVENTLTAGPGARLDWLPQETILFDGAALDRRLTLDIAGDATALLVEPVIFGRAAMGEVVRNLHWTDRVTVRRDGALIFADTARLAGDAAAQLAEPATGQGAGAMAGVIYVAPDAEGHLPHIRSLLPQTGGASLIRDGIVFARLLAEDGFTLRRGLVPLLEYLQGADLPRTWML